MFFAHITWVFQDKLCHFTLAFEKILGARYTSLLRLGGWGCYAMMSYLWQNYIFHKWYIIFGQYGTITLSFVEFCACDAKFVQVVSCC